MLEKIQQEPVIRYTVSAVIIAFVVATSAPSFLTIAVLYLTDFMENPLGETGIFADRVVLCFIYVKTSRLSVANDLASIIPALVISVFISRRRPGRLTYVGAFSFIIFVASTATGIVALIILDPRNETQVHQFPHNAEGLNACHDLIDLSVRSMSVYILIMIGFQPPQKVSAEI